MGARPGAAGDVMSHGQLGRKERPQGGRHAREELNAGTKKKPLPIEWEAAFF